MKPIMKLALALGLSTVPGSSLFAQSIQIMNEPLAACDTARVRFHDFPVFSGTKTNWIAIAEQEAPSSVSTYRFVYLPAQANGVVTLSTRGLIPFRPYEMRAFLNWEGTHSYQVVSRQEFGVFPRSACRSPMIGRVDGFVESGSPLSFTFMDMKNVSSNWVAIARADQTAPNFLKVKYLPAGSDGEASIDTTGLSPGFYELRLFEDWAQTKEYFIYSRVGFEIR